MGTPKILTMRSTGYEPQETGTGRGYAVSL